MLGVGPGHAMQSKRPNIPSSVSSPTWSQYVGYDLGRAARHISDGAEVVADALGAASGLIRTLEARWRRKRAPSPDPRVEVIVDPRARARGRYVPAKLALSIQQQPRIEWRSTIDSLEDLSRGALAVLQSAQAETSNPFLAVATDPDVGWNHLQELAEVSGLAGALRDARRVALRHDRDPVLSKLADALEALAPEQRRELGYRFLERLAPEPVVRQLLLTTGFQPVELRANDLEQLALAVASNVRASLEELGLSSAEIQHVSTIAMDVAAPLVKLSEFYLAPRTRGAKLKRYFRLHRIGLTALKIASRPSFGVEALRIPQPLPPRRKER